jgi:hypothetical protein
MYVHVFRNDGVERNNITQVNESAQANGLDVVTSRATNGDLAVEVGDLVTLGRTRQEAFTNMLNLMRVQNTITCHAPFMPLEVYEWCERDVPVQRLLNNGPVCMRFAIDISGAPFRERREFFDAIPPLGFKLDQINYHGEKLITIQRKSNSRQELWESAVEHQNECQDFFTLYAREH